MPIHQSKANRPQESAAKSGGAHSAHVSAANGGSGSELVHMQRTMGNRAFGQLLGSQTTIQTKLTVGPAGDAYEQEADRVGKEVADRISAGEVGGTADSSVQRTEGPEVEEEELQMKPAAETIQRTEGPEVEEEELQMKPAAETIQRMEGPEVEEEEPLQMKASKDGFDAAPDVESDIKAMQGAGSKMDGQIQAKMESAFGADFSNVNIHTDSKASQVSETLGAEAFATGNDIFFRAGNYNPDSRQGQELLGHELTHVIQQRGGQ